MKLGDTKKQVKKVLGKPDSTAFGDYFYPGDPGLRIDFKRGKVRSILSFSKRQRTGKGVTIGSSRAKVRATYPKAECDEGPEGPGSLICTLESRYHGRPTGTYFRFGMTDRVSEISVYYR